MSKAEQIFGQADFSEETNLKDKLRVQLFGGKNPASSAFSERFSVHQTGNGKRKSSGRILSFDELDMVTAAGEGGRYVKPSAEEEEQRKAKKLLNDNGPGQWQDPFNKK